MKYYLILFFALISFKSFAQLPTDCSNTVTVCGNSSVNLDVNGIGTQELSGSNTCGSQENNSVWLKVTSITDGTLGFTLTPNSNNITEDYDFFVFGPNVPCNNIGQAIRCSTTNPQAANQGNNLTGMNATETDTAEGPGADGNSFVRWLDVLAGETYFIVIDRPIGNSPFSLEWTGTAEFSDPPTDEAITAGTSLDLEICDSTDPNGLSQFDLSVNTNPIIGTQNNIDVTYHESESDANIGINPIIGTYNNTTNPQQIFARITNSVTGCFALTDFNLLVNLGPEFNEPSDIEDCDDNLDGDSANGQRIFNLQQTTDEILNGQPVNTFTISYHETFADLNANISPLPTLYYNTIPNTQEIFVRIEDILNPDCIGVTSINLTVNASPNAFNTTLFQCDEDGIPEGFTLFNLTEAKDQITGGATDISTRFYTTLTDAENNENEIDGNSFSNWFNPQIIYVQVTNETSGCSNIAILTLEVSSTNANDTFLDACDDDGTEDGFYQFNLLDAEADILNGLPAGLEVSYYEQYEDALLETNALNTYYANSIPYSQTIYVRVENMNACYGINEIQLTVFELPNIETEYQTLYCLNDFPETITITGGVIGDSPSNYYYDWSNGDDASEIMVNESGTYTVTVTSVDGCPKTRTVTVLPSNIATIEDIEIVDATNNNTITIFVSNESEGDYTYALDDINGPYFDNNVFENVPPGIHTVFVKDIKNDCGIVDEVVSVIGFPKYFTPNNDGVNDTWQIKGVSDQFQPNTLIYIFDRYGALITQLDPLGFGWDGTFKGNILPSSDYWFSITLQDGRTYKNHFTLKH